jgi:hypothetical protein
MRSIFEKFRSPKRISRGTWSIEVPKTISLIDERDGVLSLASNSGVGALQVSSFVKDGIIVDET